MTPSNAKQIVKMALESRGLPFTKLTARTVNFSDLARGRCLFVAIHGWQPNPAWDEIKQVASDAGFCIEAQMS